MCVLQYIGSFSVTGSDEDARARQVETQLESLRVRLPVLAQFTYPCRSPTHTGTSSTIPAVHLHILAVHLCTPTAVQLPLLAGHLPLLSVHFSIPVNLHLPIYAVYCSIPVDVQLPILAVHLSKFELPTHVCS